MSFLFTKRKSYDGYQEAFAAAVDTP